MRTLHLGVTDLPYAFRVEGETTGEVAEILEARYEVMQTFFDRNEAKIAGALEASLAGALDTLLAGGPPAQNVLGAAESSIEELFKDFLTNREIEQPARDGIPTMAAVMGVNHRLKRKSGPRRPSFIDTGLYQASFKVWME